MFPRLLQLGCPLLVLIGADACRSPTEPPIPFKDVAQGFYSNSSSADVQVARDPAAWQVLSSRFSPVPPPVDFASEMAIVVFLGSRPTGGFRVGVESVTHRGDSLDVTAVEEYPHRSCAVTQAFTQPYHAVAVPRSAGDVFVRWQSRSSSACS